MIHMHGHRSISQIRGMSRSAEEVLGSSEFPYIKVKRMSGR